MRWLLVAVPAVGLVVVAITRWTGPGWGLVVAITGGWAVATIAVRRLWEDLEDLTTQVSRWRDHPPDHGIASGHLQVLGSLGALLDQAGKATDRHLAALEADVPWRRALVDALPTAAVLFGPDGYMVAASTDARELLGMAVNGDRVTVLAALGNAPLAAATQRADEQGLVVVDTEVNGRPVRAHVTSVQDQRLVLISDRTREREVEDVRRNFVVNASHELKTPASSIRALAEALVVTAETRPDRVVGLATRLEAESQRLERLVQDLLDLRRLEDTTSIRPSQVDVVAAANEVVAAHAERAAQRDISLGVTASGPVPVLVDRDDLGLVLRNLVANAVHYNREGGSVTVTVADTDPVEVEVADTGIGIPKADLARIFERFHRVDVARSRATGGTGLGLAMVRHAVSRNGGSIEVDSLLGTGTVFRLRLPVGGTPMCANPTWANPTG